MSCFFYQIPPFHLPLLRSRTLSLGSATYVSELPSLEPADASVIDAVSESFVAPSWRGVWSSDTGSEAGFPVGGPSFGCNEAISPPYTVNSSECHTCRERTKPAKIAKTVAE